MGLDKDFAAWFTKIVNVKLLLAQLGLGTKKILGGENKQRVSPQERARKEFEAEAKSQFVKLKEKGLSIPIFTL